MKLKVIIFLLLLIALPMQAFCQDDTETIDPQELLKIADTEIFIRSAFSQDFSEDQGYVNELPNSNTIHQYYIYDGMGTDILMSFRPAQEAVRTTNKRLTFDQARKDEFHVTFSVLQAENMPSGAGGKCWIRFSNALLLGKGRESGLLIFPGDQAYYFTPVDGEMTYESVANISSVSPFKKIKFDFIRLGGITYVYANGNFQFSYEDGIKEMVSFEAGAELSVNGNRVRCNFDDFSMRTK